MSLVHRGEISAALGFVRETYPQLLDSQTEHSSKLVFLCSCQVFVELIKAGKGYEALEFMQASLSPFFHQPATFDQTLLQNVVALLAYQDPSHSPLAYLLSDHQRTLVGDALNHAILSKALSLSLCHLPRARNASNA